MEIRQLRYFVAVADERHFGRAAERLHMAQSGLSQQIKALERSVGAELFDRDARPVRLTRAGEKLLPLAKTILETASRAAELNGTDDGTRTEALRVGFPAIGHYPELAHLVERFRERAPTIDLQLTPSFRPATQAALVRRAIDVGVLFHPIDWPEPKEAPRYARLGDRELVIALPTAHRLASLDRVPRAALLEETFVDWPESFWPELAVHARRQLFGTADHPKRIEVLEALDDSVQDVVGGGAGFACLAIPADGPLPIPPSGIVYRRVEDPRPLLEYGLVWVEPNASTATATFVELVPAPDPSMA